MKLTHPERLYWPDAGITRQGLADYYALAWERMSPFVTSRPLALLRCPEGASGQCFFQKHAWKGIAPAIHQFDDVLDKSDEPMLAIRDFGGIIGLVQAGALEIHPWQASLDDLERPDQIVMDLDPGEGTQWMAVIDAAREVCERLEEAGLSAFVKTTGGKGLHVVSPLKPHAGWDAVKAFAKSLAKSMAGDSPDRYVAVVAKEKRRGKVLIDYLRNYRGATAVAPYSTRARAGAPVAMPIDWDELGPDMRSDHFNLANVAGRLTGPDPWRDFRKSEKPLKIG